MSASSITGDGSSTATGLPDATYEGTARYGDRRDHHRDRGDPSCRLGGTYGRDSAGGVDRTTSFSADVVGGGATSCTLEFAPAVPTALVAVATTTGFGIVDDFAYPSRRWRASSAGHVREHGRRGHVVRCSSRADITITQVLPPGAYETSVECTDDVGAVIGNR